MLVSFNRTFIASVLQTGEIIEHVSPVVDKRL